MNEDENTLKTYALKLISIRPRSQKEIITRLAQFALKHHISRPTTEKINNYLLDNNFINDRDFISWWIEQRQAFRPKGKIILRQELLEKGIARDLIDEKLDAELAEETEFDSAVNLLRKKIVNWKDLAFPYKKKKMSDFLLRRGFSFKIVFKAIDSILQKD